MPPIQVGGFCTTIRENAGKVQEERARQALFAFGTASALRPLAGRSIHTLHSGWLTVNDQVRALVRRGLPMETSAFEIVFLPVLWGTVCGIIAGTAILTLMRGIEALVDRLGRWARSPKAMPRTARPVPRGTHQVVVRGGRALGV
jgi:hypothetical protein